MALSLLTSAEIVCVGTQVPQVGVPLTDSRARPGGVETISLP
jgi:hypothetical protein